MGLRSVAGLLPYAAISAVARQRYDVIWTARHPGKWLIHCHIGHHTTNNNMELRGGGGLMMVIEVA